MGFWHLVMGIYGGGTASSAVYVPTVFVNLNKYNSGCPDVTVFDPCSG